jgi:hypothetical protein
MFSQNSSIYVLKFDGSEISEVKYASTMLHFKEKLKALSAKSSRRDSAWNTMMWSTFTFLDKDTSMTFYSSADARYLYRGTVSLGLVSSSSAGACRNPAQMGKVDNDGRLVFTVPTIPVSSSIPNMIDACSEQFPAQSWQRRSLSPFSGNLEVGFDLQTITCVVSVNMGITGISDYVKVSWILLSFIVYLCAIFSPCIFCITKYFLLNIYFRLHQYMGQQQWEVCLDSITLIHFIPQ